MLQSAILSVVLFFSLPLYLSSPAMAGGPVSLAPQDVEEKSSPFDGLRWSGDQPEVQVDETWYEPVTIDGIDVKEILAFADQWPPGREKRFAEDLVPILMTLKWKGDRMVDLDLQSLEDGSAVRIEGVEMTLAKREALRLSRRSASRISAQSTHISVEDAHRDVEAFGAGLKDQFAYLGLGEVDLDRELAQIREGLTGEQVDILELRLALHRLLMRFGDGHAQVRSNLPLGQAGDKYLPFLLVESSAGVVAVLPDRSALVEPVAPVVRAIDGKAMDEWIELARHDIANGSPQLVRRRALGDMREIDEVRRALGEATGVPLMVTFSTADGSETIDRELELSSRRPTYGSWPRSQSAILEGDIGYLRIVQMNDEVDTLHEAMEGFIDTKGLIVDVRGNGGGTRELLLALGGYLIDPKEPAVVGNIAQYRQSSRFDEDHLEARYMHRADWEGWNDRQREAIRGAAAAFKPEWQPKGEFSAWHYLVLDRTGHSAEYFYDLPVVVLSDSGCFSATDIFLGALELLPQVTLLGTASSGGSARSQSFGLPKTGMEVRCASMASFRPDGRLYDGRGIEVDIEVLPAPEDFLSAGGDAQLKAALERF
jgi:C-terminal processing protease CtpA/Prc